MHSFRNEDISLFRSWSVTRIVVSIGSMLLLIGSVGFDKTSLREVRQNSNANFKVQYPSLTIFLCCWLFSMNVDEEDWGVKPWR